MMARIKSHEKEKRIISLSHLTRRNHVITRHEQGNVIVILNVQRH
jgi:ribosomal protein L15E